MDKLKKTKFINSKICAVTVTYGNRAEFVKKIVASAQNEGVDHIIIINNNSDKESKLKLEKLAKTQPKFITLKNLMKNKGSAGGFKKGMELAKKIKETEFILCLDDDNMLQQNSIKNLINSWKILANQDQQNKTVFFCLRYYDVGFLQKTENELKLNNLEKDILIKNSYCYFSLEKLITLIKNKFKKRKNNNKKYYDMVCGAYGGMFFHKNLLLEIKYPDEKMFTYFDDITYTNNIYKKGIKLYLIPESKITDLETTLQNASVKSYFSINKILQNIHTMNDKKLFYGYRNRIILEKKIIDNKFKYIFNKFIFKTIILPLVKIIYFLKYKETQKINDIKQAIIAGEKYR
ncbi:MAG: glycosyltransferase [Candidatus Woesearchaeota archaeon]|jgi:GT2 family glycosyltransferase